MNHYRQCILHQITRKTDGKVKVHTSWIPEQFAYVGNWVSLKNQDGTWDDHWKVIEVGARAPEDQVLERSQDYKRTRKASDI